MDEEQAAHELQSLDAGRSSQAELRLVDELPAVHEPAYYRSTEPPTA